MEPVTADECDGVLVVAFVVNRVCGNARDVILGEPGVITRVGVREVEVRGVGVPGNGISLGRAGTGEDSGGYPLVAEGA